MKYWRLPDDFALQSATEFMYPIDLLIGKSLKKDSCIVYTLSYQILVSKSGHTVKTKLQYFLDWSKKF